MFNVLNELLFSKLLLSMIEEASQRDRKHHFLRGTKLKLTEKLAWNSLLLQGEDGSC